MLLAPGVAIRSPPFAAGAAGGAPEPRVAGGKPAPRPSPRAGGNIRRQEQGPPALDLADMGLLVVAAGIQAPHVAADDDVAEGHRRRHDDPTRQEPPGEAAVELQGPPPALDAPSRGERERT